MIEVNHKTPFPPAPLDFSSRLEERRLSGAMNLYETERLLSEYLLFHYGAREELLPWSFGPVEAWNFPARVAQRVMGEGGESALDLGCAVGRAAFELTQRYRRVIGIDFSRQFIEAARRLKEGGSLPYQRVDEGELTTPLLARLPEGVMGDRVEFEQGDAMALREELSGFDLVLAANLLCRLRDPQRCLARMKGLVKPGGRLAITTPATWMEEYTPKVHWLGGTERDGVRWNTLDALRAALEPEFTLLERDDIPFLIREHARKYQWSVAELTVWQRL